jgi:hypothetical protein
MKKLLLILICLFVSFEVKSENFTVRKNLNKVLNIFYKKGDFYSCYYDNKSYSDGFMGMKKGFTNNPKKIVREQLDEEYQIFDEIILIHTKKHLGIILSQSSARFSAKSRFIFTETEDNLFYWNQQSFFPRGWRSYFSKNKNDLSYVDDKGDLKWKELNQSPGEYDLKLNDELSNFPRLVFKNEKLKITLNGTYMDDFYKCEKFELLSIKDKKKMVKEFLDPYPRFDTWNEIKKEWFKILGID